MLKKDVRAQLVAAASKRPERWRTPEHLAGRYAIAGVGEAGMGKAPAGATALSLQCEAARQAILDAGLKPADIDGVFAHWDDRAAGLLVTEYMGLAPRYVDSTVVGGQSNLTHVVHAMAAMEAGLCDVALITYGSTQRLDRSRCAGRRAQDARMPDRPVRAAVRHAQPDRLLRHAGAAAHAPPRHARRGPGRGRAGGAALGAAQSERDRAARR